TKNLQNKAGQHASRRISGRNFRAIPQPPVAPRLAAASPSERAASPPERASPLRCAQADFFRNGFANEAVQSFGIGMFDNAGDNIALAFDGTYNSVLAFTAGSWRALIPMPVFVLSADVGFIYLDNTNELSELRVGQPSANAMAHIERGRIGTEAHHSMNLQRGNSLLAGQHEIDDLEPSLERDLRIIEDGFGDDGEATAPRFGTFLALPME